MSKKRTKWGREHGHGRQVKGAMEKVEPGSGNSHASVLGTADTDLAGGGILGPEIGGR